ncbi:MAG: hypothetical protein AAF581_00275 [Planctomycetota bacterium]
MRTPRRCLVVAGAALLTLLAGCRGTGTQEGNGQSLLGRPLGRTTFDDATRVRLEGQLAAAYARWLADSADEDAIIWYGRRLAYLSRYDEAIDVYTRGLKLHPRSARLLRHRGHRYISIRQFDHAIADFRQAQQTGQPNQIEQDGAPNKYNVPLTTTYGNILYHLGLAYYLSGDYERALEAYDARLDIDANDDNVVSTAYWRYLILQRLGRRDAARAAVAGVHESMRILENNVYQQLCLLYNGTLSRQDFDRAPAAGEGTSPASVLGATASYGLSMFDYHRGDRGAARALWEEIVASDGQYAFGTIAAEAELARLPAE